MKAGWFNFPIVARSHSLKVNRINVNKARKASAKRETVCVRRLFAPKWINSVDGVAQ